MKIRFRPVGAVLAASLVAACNAARARADLIEAWGSGQYIVSSNSSVSEVNSPTPLSGLSSGVSAIGTTENNGLAVLNGGAVTWGYNGEGELGTGSLSTPNTAPPPVSTTLTTSGVSAVAGGQTFAMALMNGAVYAWGDNTYGELGNGSTGGDSTTPALTNSGALSSGVNAISAGALGGYAIAGGALYAWGYNGNSTVGNGGSTGTVNSPTKILASNVTSVAGGGSFSMAVQNGGVLVWGQNGNGELGNGASTGSTGTPTAIGGVLASGVTAIAAGSQHALAVENGNVYAWGADSYGQVGNGATTSSVTTPTEVAISPGVYLSNIVQVAAGNEDSYALSSTGVLWVWGAGNFGALGLGGTTSYDTPQELLPPNGYVFTSVAANSNAGFVLATLAVPEPASASAMMLGAIVLLKRRRNRR